MESAEDVFYEHPWHEPKPRPRGRSPLGPWYFIVAGAGMFPFDMFRYDSAWAITATSRPSDRVEGRLALRQGHRSVIIASWERELTEGRWRSFGWVVVERLDHPPAGLV